MGAACGPAAFPSQSAEAARCCCVFWASGAQKRRRWQEVVPTEAGVLLEGEQEALPPLLRHLQWEKGLQGQFLLLSVRPDPLGRGG